MGRRWGSHQTVLGIGDQLAAVFHRCTGCAARVFTMEGGPTRDG